MRTLVGIVLVVLPATALAQPGATPNYAAPPPAAVAPAPPTPKVRLEVSLLAASPKGDMEQQLDADTSGGIGVQVGFLIAPNLDLFAGYRYINVELKDDSALPEDFELSHRELQVGLRYTSPIAPSANLFFEGNIHSAKVAVDFQDTSDSVSGMGFGGRAGLIFMADSKIGLGVAGSYSSSSISTDGEGEDLEDAWLSGDVFVSAWF
jgi:outer membrane protein assembly factor BamA